MQSSHAQAESVFFFGTSKHTNFTSTFGYYKMCCKKVSSSLLSRGKLTPSILLNTDVVTLLKCVQYIYLVSLKNHRRIQPLMTNEEELCTNSFPLQRLGKVLTCLRFFCKEQVLLFTFEKVSFATCMDK